MKLRLLALIVLCIVAGGLTAAPARVPAESDRQVAPHGLRAEADASASLRAELENRKLGLEIAKLEEGVSSWNRDLLIQAGTLLAAFIAVLISGWSAAKTLRLQFDAAAAQNDSQKRDRVSVLLKELGSESAMVRSAAIQALSEYEEAIPFLVNTLRSEQDPDVLISTVVSLNSHPEQALRLLLELSRHIYTHKLSLASSLARLGLKRQSVAQEFYLRNKDIMNWQESGAGRRVRDATAVATEGSTTAGEELIAVKIREVREQMNTAFRAHANCLRAIESLLGSQAFRGKSLALTDAYLSGLNLDGVDTSGWDFSRSTLDRAILQGCNCTKSKFDQIRAKEVSFRGSSMSEASFENAELVKVDLRGIKGMKMSFRSATLRDANVDRATIDDVIFAGAKLVTSDIRNSDLRRANFSGSTLFSTTIDTCRMSGGSFEKASFIKVDLRSLRCRRTSFTNASFNRVLIFKGDFLGANFAGSQWSDTRVRLPTMQGQ